MFSVCSQFDIVKTVRKPHLLHEIDFDIHMYTYLNRIYSD